MNILLSGYFDKNFGDDVMHEMTVKYFKNHNFYISCTCREMLAHLEKYDNVFINEAVPETDLFLNVIGTGFIYNNKFARLDKVHKILTQKKESFPKTALINCSLEPFGTKAEAVLASYDIKKYDFITCRDSMSYECLKKMAKNAQVKMFSDMVFSGCYVHNTKKHGLGIAPVSRIRNSSNFEYYKKLADFADSYIIRENKPVMLFAFDSGYENDISAVLSVKNIMKNPEMAELIIYNSDTDYFSERIAGCEFFISSRFHGIVTAVMNNVKTIAVYDNSKTERICNDFDIMGVKKSEFTAESLTGFIQNYKDYSCDVTNSKFHLKSLENFMIG